MSLYPHLHKICLPILKLNPEQRIAHISQPRWIGYPLAHKLLQKFDDIYRHPRVSRMPNIMLIGRTNNGKTELVKRFCHQHQCEPNYGGESIEMPVLYIQAPPSPNEADLYAEILTSLFERVPSASTSAKRARVLDVLKKIGLKVLCIDELQNSLAGSPIKLQQMLNTIKYLGNELQISFIALGTEDLLRAMSVDKQLQNRFEPIVLPQWKMSKEYLQLLKTFESLLPLKSPSLLHQSPLSQKLLAMSEGTIGEMSTLIKKAAIHSLNEGKECIDTQMLSTCGYTPPSDRTREVAKLV